MSTSAIRCLRTVMGINGRAAYEAYFPYPPSAHLNWLRCVLHAVRIVVRHSGADFVLCLCHCPEVYAHVITLSQRALRAVYVTDDGCVSFARSKRTRPVVIRNAKHHFCVTYGAGAFSLAGLPAASLKYSVG